MRILAIDPGTKCGWAMGADESGVWDLAVQRHESGGMRFVRLRRHLEELLPLDLIVYEEVHRHLGTHAAHIYGGIIAIIQSFGEDHAIEFRGCPVGTLKKFSTGSGRDNKDDMMGAAQRFFPHAAIVDDNHADALCLLRWAREECAPVRKYQDQAGVAQPEEQATCNRQAGGSSPPAGS